MDGSGGIDLEEFKRAILIKVTIYIKNDEFCIKHDGYFVKNDDFNANVKAGLIFEDAMLRKVMDKFDDDGSGEINFRKFATFVMGSGARDSSSVLDTQTAGRKDYVSADGGNSEMMLFRKVRMSAKGLRHAFRDIDTVGKGSIPLDDFAYILHKYDINMGDRQYKNLLKKIGASGYSVNWRNFMDYFKQDIAR